MNQKKHLTPSQRYTIECLYREGKQKTEIAKLISVHPSTVSREIKRNGSKRGIYHAERAQKETVRRARTMHVHHKISVVQWAAIDTCLREGHSPEQISGRMHLDCGVTVSHEWIYDHVIRDARSGGNLFESMRRRHKKRKHRLPKSEDRRGQIKNRVGIENRPEIVDSRMRVGDWEVDTIVSRESKSVLVTAVERKTLLTRIILATSRESAIVTKALAHGLGICKKHVLTITGDNGKEFADHEQISAALNADFYFARPYHSWERGTNENTNGLIRQYFPKKTDFSKLTAENVAAVEWKINNRPRKSLGYKSAAEIFKATTGIVLPAGRTSWNTSKYLYSICKLALAA